MQNLSIREFKTVCDSFSPQEFIFTSANQQWKASNHTLKANLSFKIMMIAFNPNVLCFKSPDNTLCLERVKYIKTSNEPDFIGRVFTVICGDFESSKNDVSYTIIAR